MALAQSQFVRELEVMKTKAKSSVEVENYTQLQISLVDHQRLVITLQDTLREREALVQKLMQGPPGLFSFVNYLEGRV